MTWTPTVLNLKDANNTTQPVIAYTDGTNFSFAHPILDNTGAVVAPATSGNQTTANASLNDLDTNLGAKADSAATTDTGTFSLISLFKRGLQTLASILTAAQAATPAGSAIIGKVGIDQTTPGTTNGIQVNAALPAGANIIGKFTTDQTTHGVTDLVAADITKVAGTAITTGHGTAAGAIRVELPTDGTGAIASVGSITNPLPAGTNLLGAVNLDIGGSAHSSSNPIFIEDAYLAPVATTWTSATTLNTAQTSTTNGMDTVIVSFVPTGSITGGVITFEVYDGAAWLPIKAARIESYNTEGTYTLTGTTRGWQIPVAGFPQFRIRLSTVITGTGSAVITTIVSSAPDTSVVTVGLDPSQALPAGSNVIGGVTVADGSDSTIGAKADAAVTNPSLSGSLIGLIKGVLTAVNSLVTGTVIAAGTAIIGKVGIDQTTPGTTNGVQVNAALPAGTNLIGKFGIDQTTPGTTNGVQVNAALPAGTNTIGAVNNAANTSGGTSTYAALGGTGNALLTNSAIAVKASAGNLYGLCLVNTGNATAYVQLFDLATGSVTLGTTVPKLSFYVPANGTWEEQFADEAKISFLTAITAAATTTPTGSTAPSTGVLANIIYK